MKVVVRLDTKKREQETTTLLNDTAQNVSAQFDLTLPFDKSSTPQNLQSFQCSTSRGVRKSGFPLSM